MFLSIFAFLVALAAFIVAGSVVWRHWKEIRLLDPLSIKEEQQRLQREAMIQRRFERVQADHLQPLKRLGQRLKRSASQAYKKTYERLQALETLYRNVKNPLATMAPTARERMKKLTDEARSLTRDLKWADAERRYLEVLQIDPRQADAYKGLGQIYLKQKLYPQAKETFEFLIKIKKADDATYSALAEIAEAEGNPLQAEAMRLKAVELSPRQAHRHAELAAYYLNQNQPAKAWPSAKRASDLEPKSAKYLEGSLETAILLGDRNEARKRFERLRLLSEDRSKFQQWREKIEAMEAAKTEAKK